MIHPKVLEAFVAVVLVSSASGQYETYEREDDTENDEGRSAVDYSKYFDGGSGVIGPVSTPLTSGNSAGFVQPLDFTGFFAGGHFGLDGLAGGASQQQVFQIPGGVSLGQINPGGGFMLEPDKNLSSNTGFVNGMNFKSLFDTSASPSTHGFRPQDFLPREAQAIPQQNNPGFFSPAFDSLQHDVDREVDYQRREEKAIEESRQASKRIPEEDDSDDDPDEYDSSEHDIRESPLLDQNDRSPQKYTKHPYEGDREYDLSNAKQISYITPYSRVNHYHNPPIESRNYENTKRIPLPTRYESDEDDAPPTNKPNDNSYLLLSPKQGFARSKNIGHNYQNKNIHQSSEKLRLKNDYVPHLTVSQDLTRSRNNNNEYPSRRPNHPKRVNNFNSHTSTSPSDFKPSPRDPYLDSIRTVHSERSLNGAKYPISSPEKGYRPSSTLTRVNNRHISQPVTAASENKSCRRINKKIDPKDFSRFKRQQMTCYICKNKKKGNTYEECSYESEPKGQSFYKGSTEAYSSDELLSPAVYQTRERRSLSWQDKNKHMPTTHKRANINKNHGRYVIIHADEKGHGNEHYIFGPEYFENGSSNNKKSGNRNPRRYDSDRDEYEDEGEEESDIEKEYEPPGVSDDDRCEQVNRNGLICMVCENPKSGGSYEQCSYASDPESNKYEYAKHTTYGSKRRPDRYKRYSEHGHRRNDRYDEKESYWRPVRLGDRYDSKDSNRRNKLKRKKVNSRYPYNKADSRSDITRKKVVGAEKTNELPGVVGLDPFFYGSPGKSYDTDEYDERGKRVKLHKNDPEDDDAEASTTDDESEEAIPTYEDAFFRLFPELEGTNPYTGEHLSSDRKEPRTNERRNQSSIPYVDDEEESESKQRSEKVKPDNPYGVELPSYYFDDDESKKDLEKTLDEFVQKNRSNCKKVMKEEMTCYQCVNTKGMQHEECMFVVASEPQNKHLAYHEVKEFRMNPEGNGTSVDSSNKELNHSVENRAVLDTSKTIPQSQTMVTNHHTIPGRNIIKRSKLNVFTTDKNEENHKITTFKPLNTIDQHSLVDDILRLNPKETSIKNKRNSSAGGFTRIKRKPLDETKEAAEIRYRYKNGANPPTVNNAESEEEKEVRDDDNDAGRDEEQENKSTSTERDSAGRSKYNSVPPDPEGFDEREGPEGAYSHETEPVYDSRLKMTLPKYMLTRSEHEQIFDEVLRSG